MNTARNSSLQVLSKLRTLMKDIRYVTEPLQAYIILSSDVHQNEYVADRDRRRQFITGFTGSNGKAIVTEHHAALWTDGRYWLQASQEIDSNWTLMKDGLAGTPSDSEWLGKILPVNSKIGVDFMTMTTRDMMKLQSELDAYGHILVPVTTNLIDIIWENRPDYSPKLIFPLASRYTGKSSAMKLDDVREKMKEKGAIMLVVTALDQIAWLLNLRGSDIPYNPVFYAYVMITLDELFFFPIVSQFSHEILTHFRFENLSVQIQPYESFFYHFEMKLESDWGKGGKIWVSEMSSAAVSQLVPRKQLIKDITPIELMKAIKNDVEIIGMKNAHLKDAAALCRFFAWLEKELRISEVTEISAAEKLLQFRKMQDDFVGPSFETISSSGKNAAIIHYAPTPATDRKITDQEMYLCDSGGQYRDGTTDVTRTMHFGVPTQYQKECFTRVFKGQKALATTIFPEKIKGHVLDVIARKSLWDVGLDYKHGTGHGVGAFLNVHEGPLSISYKMCLEDPGLQKGMFVSNEPGYYETGEFGIRLEDIVLIVDGNPKYENGPVKYLGFETVTFVPILKKMLLAELLSEDEINYLDNYHAMCRERVSPLLKDIGDGDALRWLIRETEPIG